MVVLNESNDCYDINTKQFWTIAFELEKKEKPGVFFIRGIDYLA